MALSCTAQLHYTTLQSTTLHYAALHYTHGTIVLIAIDEVSQVADWLTEQKLLFGEFFDFTATYSCCAGILVVVQLWLTRSRATASMPRPMKSHEPWTMAVAWTVRPDARSRTQCTVTSRRLVKTRWLAKISQRKATREVGWATRTPRHHTRLQKSTAQYSAVLSRAVQYSRVPYSTEQHRTLL